MRHDERLFKWLTAGFLAGLLLCSSLIAQTSITFTFANPQLTGTSPRFFEFDVMAAAGAGGTFLGDNLVYLNYNTLAFGTSISSNGKVTVTKGTLLQGELVPGLDLYDLVNTVDNSPSRLAVTAGYNYPGAPGSANPLPTVAGDLIHVKIEIADENQTSALSFEESLMIGQQFESDNATQYSPVTATDNEDSSLPVSLSSFTARVHEGAVQLEWSAESEVNNLGFEVWKSNEEMGQYRLIGSYETIPALQGQGNSSTRHDFSYTDTRVVDGQTYWYYLVDVDFTGNRITHEPLSITLNASGLTSISGEIPDEFKLHPNYPNPFNPSTTLQFDIPAQDGNLLDIKVVVYNTLGQVVKVLYRGKTTAGSYLIQWDGTSETGSQAPSGLYFASFIAPMYNQTIRLMLIK